MTRHLTAEAVIAKACDGKVRHPNAERAHVHADRLGAPFVVYRCVFCRCWHVGHPPSLESMQAIARVARGLDPNPPQEHQPMPAKPRRRCTADPTCPNAALPGGACVLHTAERRRKTQSKAERSYAIYRSKRWRKLRRRYLTEHPYCEWGELECMAPAVDVDHVLRIEEGGAPWDEANLQALCKPHHSTKTARETGFGGRAHD